MSACYSCEHSAYCLGTSHCLLNHHESCEYLQRYRRVVKDQALHGHVKPALPIPAITPRLPTLTGMEQFFTGVCGQLVEPEFLELTEQSTYPLTALKALSTLPGLLDRPKLTIHVIGAEVIIRFVNKWVGYLQTRRL